MTGMLRVKLRWSGWSGGPGLSVFHFRDFGATGEPTQTQATDAVTRINTFATAVKAFVPNGITLQATSDVEVIEETTGQLVSVFSVTNNTAHAGTASASNAYASSVGMNVTWRTDGIRNGRRIKGRTFLVPLTSTTFDNTGTPAPGSITALGTAAAALIDPTGTPDLGVYARPTSKGATDGIWTVAKSYSIPDLATVLRSRRD